MPRPIRTLVAASLLAGGLAATATAASAQASAVNGQKLAQRQCGGCHAVSGLKSPLTGAPAFATATLTYDGKTTTVPMAEGEAILDAGERAGLVLPWSCRGGMCGTCRARLLEGEVTMAQNFALEPWETEAGLVLTCQSHPTSAHVAGDYDHV